ncbi:MAG TPA: IPT/TIG domain-containing protein, partial [Candidatus Sulfopaludibacter sp.]|nr:IPT/TIG domain-containing protein [Candidatus Sulfopaludibacter sp.]
TLTILVQNLSTASCAALAGAYVDIWHCDAKGIYSDEATYNPGGGTGNVTTTGQKFLRGYQITDSNGQVQFTTVYPGWYSGRTIHIHVRVRTYNGTTVLGNFVTQIFFDDTTNNTVLAQSAYSRTTARDTSNATDMVYNVANQTRMLASLTGGVNAGYAAAITFGVSLTAPPAAAPAVTAGGVGNAVSGAAGVSPNTWISIYGSNFSPAAQTLTSADLVNNTIPTSLGAVAVQINGKAAFVEYVSPTQINVLAPADSSLGTVSVSVTNSAGTSGNVTTIMSTVLPGLAVLSNYVRAIRYPDGVIINGTGNAETGFTTSAAAGPGDIIALFGTGFGPTNPGVQPGPVFTGAYPTTNTVTVMIGSVSAQVLWAGLSAAGLDQINVQIPSSLADGDYAVVATVAGVGTQANALLKVAASAAYKAQASFGQIVRLALFNGRTSSRAFRPLLLREDLRVEDIIRLAGLFGAEHRAGAPRRDLHRVAMLQPRKAPSC